MRSRSPASPFPKQQTGEVEAGAKGDVLLPVRCGAGWIPNGSLQIGEPISGNKSLRVRTIEFFRKN